MRLLFFLLTTALFSEEISTTTINHELNTLMKSRKAFELTLHDNQTIHVSQIIDLSLEEVSINILHDRRMGYNKDIITMEDYYFNENSPKLLRHINLSDIKTINELPSFYENPTNVITLILVLPLILMFLSSFNTI